MAAFNKAPFELLLQTLYLAIPISGWRHFQCGTIWIFLSFLSSRKLTPQRNNPISLNLILINELHTAVCHNSFAVYLILQYHICLFCHFPRGSTPLYTLCRYVPLDRVWFLSILVWDRVYQRHFLVWHRVSVSQKLARRSVIDSLE